MPVKSTAQERRAIAERNANARAQARGLPLPHPNPWDAVLPKMEPDATEEEQIAWVRDFVRKHAPDRPSKSGDAAKRMVPKATEEETLDFNERLAELVRQGRLRA